MSFKTFLADNQLNEVLITFGKQRYPKFGQVVILAGGAASGKGFIKDKLLGIEGKNFDVDQLKELAIASKHFSAKVKEETGKDLTKFNLKDPKDVALIHSLLSDVYNVIRGTEKRVFAGIATADPERKPNLIFDVTLKDVGKLRSICRQVTELGYLKENIHIVWVMNDVKVALKQNAERSRTVPEEILISTHKGAAETMSSLLAQNSELRTHMDGDIWIAFNKRGVDSIIGKSSLDPSAGPLSARKDRSGVGMYVVHADIVNVKEKGKPVKSVKEIGDDLSKRKMTSLTPDNLASKIASYAPGGANADFKKIGR